MAREECEVEVLEESALKVVTDLIRRRRSLKPTSMDPDREVADELLEQLLENATWAPSHGLTQPWRFVVFSGHARKVLAEKLQQIYLQEVPEKMRRDDKFKKLGINPTLASVVVALGVSPKPGGKISVQEEVAAVACAAQNVMLSATAVGLGSFWSSPSVLASRSMITFLGWHGSLDECVGLLYLGWPLQGAHVPTSRRDALESKMSWRGKEDENPEKGDGHV